MKVKIEVVPRLTKSFKQKRSVLDYSITILSIITESIFNTFLPFVFGVYFVLTQNLIFLVLFIILLFFHLRIDWNNRKLEIKIFRG